MLLKLKKYFKKNVSKKEISILIRYISLFLLVFFYLNEYFLQFMIFIYTQISYYFLQFFVPVIIGVNGLELYGGSILFSIVNACIASEAYMLISFIFLSIPFKNLKLLFKIIFKAVLWFSLFNLIRILLLMSIYLYFGVYWFEKLHLIFYEGLSGVITAFIIIYFLRSNGVRSSKKLYPLVSDLIYLIGNLRKR